MRMTLSAQAASIATVVPGIAARATISQVGSREVSTAAGTARVITYVQSAHAHGANATATAATAAPKSVLSVMAT
ncbi:MAG: hypothetical protein QOH20_4689, partial [Mycobacterium sp.]|nr:hypothetical protein [Mycobacterium sp.]